MSHDREALRQQMLLRALWQDARPGVVGGWLQESTSAPARFERALQAYRANGRALAERALAAAYPVLQQLLGDESFAAMARAFWHAQPPLAGDMAQWGAALPAFVEAADPLVDEPYLADVARVEWALHTAASAADAPQPTAGLARLAEEDPARLRLVLVPGAALVVSAYPVVTLWQAHQVHQVGGGERETPSAAGRDAPQADADRFAAARQALAERRAEAAFVCREGLVPVLHVATPAEARWLAALLAGESLAAALAPARAGADFDFGAWLVRALERRWLAAVEAL